MRCNSLDSAGRHARSIVAIAQPARTGQRQGRDYLQFGIAQRLSGNACDIERLVPERGQGQTNRKHRLPSGHDGRSDRGAANWPGHATPVAGALDGPALGRGAMRQRLCLRLSEQSFVVLADDAAAGGSSPADRVRESLWRRGLGSRAPRCAQETGQLARFGCRRTHAPAEDAGTGRSQSCELSIWILSATSSGESSMPKRLRRTIRRAISIAHSAFRRRTPTMPG